MINLKIKNQSIFWIAFVSILLLAQARGQNASASSSSSSCGGVLELSSGVLDFSPVDRNGQTPDLCMWVIKLPATSQNIQFQLTQIPPSSQLNLYSQEGHVAGQFSILPIASLTTADINNLFNTNSSNVIAIWTPSRVKNGDDSTILSFKWDGIKFQPGNEGRDLKVDLVGGVNYVEADRGRFSWVKPGESQQTLLWVLNSKSQEFLELKIETEFQNCDLIDPCLCSYFGVYEVYDDFLRAVYTECARSSSVQKNSIRPHLVALSFVHPEFRRDTNHVTLSWMGEEPEEGTTTTTTETTETTPTTTEIPTTTTEEPFNCSSGSGFPKSCSEIQFESESNSSQLQNCLIYPDGPDGESLVVLCDFDVDGGGWTIIQKRSSGPQDQFDRVWSEYVEGFGSPEDNFWLGLENIRALTKEGNQELRIELEDFEGEKRWAKYSSFAISDASDFYRLTISGFSGDATDSMTNPSYGQNNDMRFSTKDVDNDNSPENCAEAFPGGWWFNDCGGSFLNGIYREEGETVQYLKGIHWTSWKGFYESLAKIEMKIRNRK